MYLYYWISGRESASQLVNGGPKAGNLLTSLWLRPRDSHSPNSWLYTIMTCERCGVRLVGNSHFFSPFSWLTFTFLNCGLGLCGKLKVLPAFPQWFLPLIPGNCNCEKGVFADVDWVKYLEMRLPWVMQEVPKGHYRCPYKREAEGHLNTDRRGVNHTTTKAEVGVMWPQVRRWCSHRKLEEARTGSSPRASGGNVVLPTS